MDININTNTKSATTVCEKPIVEKQPTKAESMSTLKKQTARGIKWLVLASFFQKALSFGTMVILARILNPSIFGLFALAFVAINGLGLFKSMGVDSALIQRQENIEKAANTAFFIIPLLGIFLFLVLSISAPYVGKFLNSTEVIPVIRILGAIFVFNCFARIPKVLLQKEMRFAKIAFAEAMGAIVYSTTAIVMALLGMGIWSLVIGYLAKTIVSMIAIWYFSKWKPSWQFDKKIAFQMFNFGKFVFLASIVYFLRMNLSHLLVGKFLGMAMLGVYALSFNISNILVEYLSGRMEKVIYPAYSKRQHDNGTLKKSYLDIFKITSFIALPFTFCVYFLKQEFVHTIYGPKWLSVIPVIGILIWSGLFRMFATSAGSLFMAKGKPQYGFWLSCFQVLIFLIFIKPFAEIFGARGVAMVITGGVLINTSLIMLLCKRLISVKISELIATIRLPLFATLVMSISILAVKWMLSHIILYGNHAINLAISLCVALGSYTLFMLKFDRKFISEIKNMVFNK